MIYDLSVLVPGIRTGNWKRLYDSVEKSFSGNWEIIFIGPYDLPEELKNKENVVYVQSWRSPIACQQQALCMARGETISWAADDGFYLPNSLNIAHKLLINEPYTTIVTAKYMEGENPIGMDDESYYVLYNHASMKLPFIPKNAYMLNCGLIPRILLVELGGWDSSAFQTCPMAYSDFAIRAYRHGCKFILQKEIMFSCSHEPGTTGTHGPIHYAQTEHDEPLFRGIYSHESCLIREKIRLENWEDTELKWNRRFK